MKCSYLKNGLQPIPVDKNVVDYSDHYRGIQSVVLSNLEAYTKIILSSDHIGT